MRDLHSTVVLLKVSPVLFQHFGLFDLHSTVVLLKDCIFFPPSCSFLKFTFYCSSIKSLCPMCQWRRSMKHLHSTVVLLKGEQRFCIFQEVCNLHSTVVLLKELVFQRLVLQPVGFTFYCSSIKSGDMVDKVEHDHRFTFYCSSIKSLKYSSIFRSNSSFTFYCSSIKSRKSRKEQAGPGGIYILL